ncbi:MAG: hypothetical protein KF777_15700 [Planctomycetaceae bacterium]|nr:hypothetical protein [Planctomycetaceae bacterium]
MPCLVYVHRLAVRDDHDASQFQQELAEQSPPILYLSRNLPGQEESSHT